MNLGDCHYESESRSVVSNSLRPHGYTVHGILQARVLEWVAFPFSRGAVAAMSPALTPAQPAPQEHGGAAAAPAEPGWPPAPRYPASGRPKRVPRRHQGRPGPAPLATTREVESPARGLPTRVNKAHTEWGWRPGRAAPSTRALRPPSRAQSLGARGLRAGPRRPPARRYLVGAPPPGPRPAPCAAAAAALFWRRFNSRPREKLSLPRDPAARVRPEPWKRGGCRPRASLPRGAIVCTARPSACPVGRARQGPRGSRARPPHSRRPLPPSRPRPGPAPPPARVRARQQRVAAATRRGGQRPETRPGPRPRRGRHAAPGPSRPTRPPARRPPPAALRTRAAHNRFHSLGGGAGRLTRRSSRHHLRLARRGLSLPPPHPPPLYYDRRPQAGGAASRPARPAEGASRGGASRGGAAGVVPTPSASPEGAKWREGAGRAAAAAPRRTMIIAC